MSREILSKTLDVNSAKTMTIGATLIDTDDSVGYINDSRMGTVRHPDQCMKSLRDALQLYPAVVNTQQENADDENAPILTMANCWLNGFAPHTRGLPPSDQSFMSQAAGVVLTKYGVVTTEQIFKARPDPVIQCLFSAFKWYGGNDDDARIIPTEYQTDDDIGKNVRKGMAHPNWFIKPLPVRYMVRMRGDSSSRDYVYLIGGSPEMVQDNPDNLASEISRLWHSSNEWFDEARALGTTPNSVSRESLFTSPTKVWHEIPTDAISEDDESHPFTRATLARRKMQRIVQGVVLIRNYLKYAGEYIPELEEINEFNYNVSDEPSVLKITEVAERYERIYQYVRNLANIHEEIADGKLDG